MPAIPVYQPQVDPAGSAQLPGVTPEQLGANVGAAIRYVGQQQEGVEEGRKVEERRQAAIKRQRDDEDAQADAAVKFATFQAQQNKARLDAREVAPAGAVDHAKIVLQGFDQGAADVSATVTNPKAQAWLKTRMAELRGDIDVDESTFERGARVAKMTSDIGTAREVTSNNLFTDPTVKNFQDALKAWDTTRDALSIPADVKAKLDTETRDLYGTSFVRGLAQKDPYAARQLLQSGQLNSIIDGKHLPSLNEAIDGEIRGREAEVRRQQAEARREAAEARREYRERQRDIAASVEDAVASLTEGRQPAPGEVGQLVAAAHAAGRPQLARRAEYLGTIAAVTAGYRSASPKELQDYVHKLDAKINAAGAKASTALLAEREGATELLGTMTQTLRSDPLSWASRAGTAQIAPIDWNDPNTMRARIKPAMATAQRYGVAPQYLTDEEKGQLQAYLSQATPQQKLQVARNLSLGFGRQTGQALMTMGQSQTFTHAAGLAGYGGRYADVARRIFIGQDLAKTSQVLPSSDKIDALAADELGRSLAYQGKTRAAAVSAANALYVERASQRGLTKDKFDPDLWKQGLNEALGGIGGTGGLYTPGSGGWVGYVRSNKPSVVLPVGMSGQRFDDLLYGATPAELKAAGVGGKGPMDSHGRPIDAATFAGASLFSAGDGKYLVSLDKNGTQFLRGGGKNGFYILDMRALDRVRAAKK